MPKKHRHVPSILVRMPRRRPHKSFPKTMHAGQTMTFARPVAITSDRTTQVRVRFLAPHETAGIESAEEKPLQFSDDNTPLPPPEAGGV